MTSGSNNGKSRPDDNDSNDLYSNGFTDDDETEAIVIDKLSDIQMELLRHAIVEHGKRLGELEAKMDKTLEDLLAVRTVIDRAHVRMTKIAKRLGIEL